MNFETLGNHPTFPVGLTLREYFAAQALNGLLSNPICAEQWKVEEMPAHAVRCADALIAALNVKEPA